MAFRKATVAWFPFTALVGTTIGSFVWGWLADVYGRRVSILLSTILFVSTSICGAMPLFELNLLMCFLMGCSAGGMLPVVYTLLAEIMPPQAPLLGAGAGRRDRPGRRLSRGERRRPRVRAGLRLARAVAAGLPDRHPAARPRPAHPGIAALPGRAGARRRARRHAAQIRHRPPRRASRRRPTPRSRRGATAG